MATNKYNSQEHRADFDGHLCKCAAYGKHECSCDADWTPRVIRRLQVVLKHWHGAPLKFSRPLWHDINYALEDLRILKTIDNERIKRVEEWWDMYIDNELNEREKELGR